MAFDFAFPVKKLNEALAVTEPNTNIDVFEKHIYVDLDAVRGDEFMNNIKTQLGFNANNDFEGTYNFVKLLFTGHRGSGKSTELKKVRKELEDTYFVVPIFIEQDVVKITAIESEDLYQLFTLKLAERLVEANIKFDLKTFEEISNIWLKETDFTTEYIKKATIEAGSEVEAKASIWVAAFKAFLKSSISAENKDTEKVRQKIKVNINEIILKLNNALSELRYVLKGVGYEDILYIIDGTEKINYELSKKIFIQDAALLNQINAHFIFSSPVFGLYDINKGNDFFTPLTLPMIKLNPQSIEVLKQIIAKRVDITIFFEANTLDCIAKKSGGCVRQLLQIVHKSIVTSRGNKVTNEILNKTLYEMGRGLFDQLNTEHREVLQKGYAANNNFVRGDNLVKEMLFNLSLIACNGTTIINPLIEPFVTN